MLLIHLYLSWGLKERVNGMIFQYVKESNLSLTHLQIKNGLIFFCLGVCRQLNLRTSKKSMHGPELLQERSKASYFCPTKVQIIVSQLQASIVHKSFKVVGDMALIF